MGEVSLIAQSPFLARYSLMITLAVSGMDSSIRFFRSLSKACSISSLIERVNLRIMS